MTIGKNKLRILINIKKTMWFDWEEERSIIIYCGEN